jgi:TatD DNase family protein
MLDQALQVRLRARAAGVAHCVIPAVEVGNFEAVRRWRMPAATDMRWASTRCSCRSAEDSDLQTLDDALHEARIDDPRLVAVGEIGLDFFVPALCEPAMRERQEHFYRAQLRLARFLGLPVILHVRRSADHLLRGLRQVGAGTVRLARHRTCVRRQRAAGAGVHGLA